MAQKPEINRRRFVVYLPADIKKLIRMKAALKDMNMSEYVRQIIIENLTK